MSGTKELRKVTMVWPPSLTVTVAAPAPRLVLAINPAGEVLTEVSVKPGRRVSETATVPAGTNRAALQAPPGAAPA